MLIDFYRPLFPPIRALRYYIDSVNDWALSNPCPTYRIPIQGFQKLATRYGITDTILEVLLGMSSLTMAIDHYVKGRARALTVGTIHRTRTAIQQQLLSLPVGTVLSDVSASTNLYECCRLTAVIYSLAVIYPIPNTYDVLQTLVRKLKVALLLSNAENETVCSEILLWMFVLGGIGALDKPERGWFVACLVVLVSKTRLNLTNWKGVEAILEKFLWLESACDGGGRLLWSEVMDLRR